MAANGNRRQGWFWAHNAIVDVYGAQLGPLGVAVYAVLARHANAAGNAWPSKATIADKLGISKRSVDKAIHQLEACHLVRVSRRRDAAGDAAANLYLLLPVDSIGDQDLVDQEEDSPSPGSPSTVFPSGAPGALPLVQKVHHPPAESAPPSDENAGGSAPNAPPPARQTPATWLTVRDGLNVLPGAILRDIDCAEISATGAAGFVLTLPTEAHLQRLQPYAGDIPRIARRKLRDSALEVVLQVRGQHESRA